MEEPEFSVAPEPEVYESCIMICANCSRFIFDEEEKQEDIDNLSWFCEGVCERRRIQLLSGASCNDWEPIYFEY